MIPILLDCSRVRMRNRKYWDGSVLVKLLVVDCEVLSAYLIVPTCSVQSTLTVTQPNPRCKSLPVTHARVPVASNINVVVMVSQRVVKPPSNAQIVYPP